MKQTSQRFSSIIFAFLVLVVAAVVFFEFVQPEYGNLMALKGQVSAQQQFLANQQEIATKMQSVLASVGNQASSSQAVNLALPVGVDSAGAIAQLYGLAGASSLTIQSVGISLQAAQQTASQSTAASAPGTANVASLIKPAGSITFQVTASGSYEGLKTFLQGLETNVRIFDVKALSIKPVPTVTTAGAVVNGSQDLYNYSITVVAYYQSP